MVDQPTGDVEIPDDILDQAVAESWDSDSSTADPAPAPSGRADDESAAIPDKQVPDNSPAGDVTVPAAAAQPETSASAPAAPAGKPFQFNAVNSVHTLAGALELPDGSVLIPKDSQVEFRRELASGRELQANFKQLQRNYARDLNAAKAQRTEKDVEADAVIALFGDLQKMSPEERWNYLVEFDAKIPDLKAEIRQKQLDEREQALKDRERGPQPSDEERQEKFVADLSSELEVEFQAIEKNPAFAALTPTERQQLKTRWSKNPARLARRAMQDDPANGIKAGDTLFDPAEVYEDIGFILANKPKPPSAAAAQNAARNADKQSPANRIPPVVNSRAPAGPARDKDGKFKSRQEWRKAFKDDPLEDEDAA